MVMRRTDNMKRKRKEECTSPLLDDSPKRTKVHAQRKFAQGSNVNSPVITPVKEIETERSPINVLPEPVELLPIKRPNTEDFLTFLCFRGTPILPPNLNFFNTASIVDTNGQVHEIKSESPKNGPIDTSVIAKCGSSTEKPFIAYGVRKRADPIVISKQMDRKRRHALAIQALRRKYQEQKMAKIRALTISKLSEKVTNKTLVRTNSVSKTETITKKTNTIEKTKVVATKHVKVTTQTLKTTLRPKKMCLRSFRGRFVQRELQFRSGGKRRPIADKKPVEKKSDIKNEEPTSDESEYSSDDHAPLSTPATSNRVTTRQTAKIIKKPAHLTTRSTALGSRVTRSGHLINKIDPRRQQIKKRMLLTSTQTIIKPRSLRSTTIRKTVLSKMPSATLKIKRKPIIKEENIVQKAVNTQGSNKSSTNVKQDVKKLSVNVKKSLDIKKEINKVEIKKETCKSEVKKDNRCNENKKEVNKSKDVRDVRKELNKSVEIKKEIKSATLDTDVKKDINVSVVEKSKCVLENSKKDTQSRRSGSKTNLKETDEKSTEESEKIVKKLIKKESTSILKKEVLDVDSSTVKNKERSPQTRSEKTAVTPRSTRPSRKTKEAAAIYMELLSQKLVHDSKLDDDDSTSIDSFPELPNVKRTEQRENELKAQAKNTKSDSKSKAKGKNSDKKDSTKKNVDTEQEDEKELSPEKKKSLIKRKSNNCDSDQNDNKKLKLNKNESKEETKATLESPVKTKIEETKQENTESKRQTRNSSQNIKLAEDSEDSDESFHADIKIPRQKKVTRSSTVQPKIKVESEDEELNELIKRVQEQESSVESDSSVTSSNKSKSLKCKTKKFSKIKSKQNTDVNFSDSDEEPLSKLTTKNTETSQKSSEVERSTRRKSDTRRSAKSNIESETNQCAKPKRECAKRPQNYLPMFSSTDEEDEYFDQLGKVEVKTPKLPTEKPASDLLSKDVKRRFGKEKVNMSNEQIEKWLKDSAMAGNDVKSENDAMLKFGECIPTETTLETNDQIDTAKLKSSLLNDVKSETFVQSNNKEKLKLDIKPQALDRKLIFKKAKKEPIPIPNVNAFSPENESSVYAFGDDHDETPSTPFRRPSRRPSSTATSKSEDELSKVDEYYKMTQFRKPSVKQETVKVKEEIEEENLPHFNMPQKPSISKKSETQSSNKNQKSSKTANLDVSDDVKYKVPSSPSASSSSSAKLSKKQTAKIEFTIPTLVQDFPAKNAPAQLVEAPVFHPSEQEFQDPIEYIERIRNKAEQFGICKIVPPSNFKPECKVSDDMRFTAYNQYVHKMLHRWGPNFKELMAIKKYLETQNISLSHPPWIGGMEIDLPRLYQTVQNLGGLKEVIEKKKWPRVSECMKIPKSAQDRVTKLDDIYCKYLLPYDTLSPAEREKLFDEVETEWAKRESKSLIKAQQDFINDVSDDAESESDDDEIEECIVKGRNMALNAFYRIARNTMSMYFKTTEPPAQEVEQEFWRHVSQRQNHICVHSGSIDSGSWGYGFSVSKNSPFARHAWNLKVLTNNSGSVLRSMGPIMGVTVPTLHVGMVFSACCWYRDPHGLPWVEYLHTGGNKIWYGIPNSSSELFHTTMKKLVPNYCRNKNLWLPSDTAMVPPNLLVDNNVSLCRVVQEPGQFIVVFPKAFTSSISTGYVVSESVYFATPYWLKTARSVFDDLKNSCEPSMFSFERLLISITTDTRSNIEVLKQILPSVQEICDNEKMLRDKLKTLGNIEHEKLPLPEGPNSRRKKKIQGDDNDYECEICRKNLFVSMVFDSDGDVVYCLEHAIKMLEDKKITLSKCKLMFTYAYDELDGLVKRIHSSIELKMQKKIPNKYAGMPTLLTK